MYTNEIESDTHAQLTHKQTRTDGIDGSFRMLFYVMLRFFEHQHSERTSACAYAYVCDVCMCMCMLCQISQLVRYLCVIECCFHFSRLYRD